MSVQLSVFIARSLDGYIAATDGSLDWLDEAAADGEDYGWDSFIESVDALAMGRGTYDHIADIDPLPFGDKPIFVFTHRPPEPRPGVTFWSVSPMAAAVHWEEMGLGRVYVDGGVLISQFLEEGYIDDMLITHVPRLLGDGLPLFVPIGRSTNLRLESVQPFPSGMVNLLYRRGEGPVDEASGRQLGGHRE